MSFFEVVRRAKTQLSEQGRVSLRALRREFELDDEGLEELVEELVDIQRVAAREERALAWVGEDAASPAPATAAPAPPERVPRDYTPRHLADRILRSKSALEGERKQVTVLFCDVRGSMELAEQVGAERWHEILDRFFSILADGVHRFEGTVNQYTGDGIMALFGAPIAHEDHAQRACYAALWLRDALRAFAQELRREHGVDFATRIGLNSGDVVVGKIGDDLRMDYTAQGHTVGLAQRMEALAEAGAVYLSEATARIVGGYFELEDLGDFRVKGAAEPLRVHALSGVGELRTRLDLSRSRGLSRFVGRGDELALLESALERADAGQGKVVGIVAEAGTGKSRLCFEFAERCRAHGTPVLEAWAPPHSRNVPMLPVMQLLRGAFGIEERDAPQSARDKIAGRIVLRDESLTRALPLLFDLLGVPDPERPAGQVDAEIREREILNVMRALLRSRSARSVGVIAIEDLHWLDPASERFLSGLIDAVAGTRTLVVVNFRPEYRADWVSRSYSQQISLQPLGDAELGELLDDLLGPDPSLRALRERLLVHTGGNPFFIEEVIHGLAERGVLDGERGDYRLVGSADALDIPPSVQGILAARIDALPEREKRVLQSASVIGPTVRRTLLEVVTELPELELDEALRRLVASELLYESSLYPEPEFSFKHALTRDVAYGSLLGERRTGLHAALADAIETLEAERLDEHAALIAHHRGEAGQELEAARAHRRAAIWVGMRSLRENQHHWNRVGELASRLPETEETRGLGVQAHGVLLAHTLGVEESEAERLFDVARGWAERSDDPALMAQLRGNYGGYLWGRGEYDAAAELLSEAFASLMALGRTEMAGGLIPRFSMALHSTGALRQTIEQFENARAQILASEEAGKISVGVRPLGPGFSFHAIRLAEVGRIEDGAVSLARAYEIVTDHADPAELSLVEMNAARFDEYRGAPEAALAHWARVEELGALVTSGPVLALAQLERWSEARRALDALSPNLGAGYQGTVTVVSSRVCLEQGEPDRARRLLQDFLADCPRRGARMDEIRAQLGLARVLARSEGAAARAAIESALARAKELIEHTDALWYRASLAEERAELQRARGDDAGARAALSEAHRLYAEMGATGHAERLASGGSRR